MFLNFNGEVREEDELLLRADNRGFRYGDGLFETMLIRSGVLRLGDYHFDRLIAGMRLLRLEFPGPFSVGLLQRQLWELCARNGLSVGSAVRVRLTVFRNGGGLYNAPDREAGYVIQVGALPDKFGVEGKADGLVLDVFPEGRKACDVYSGIKSNNYLLSTQAGLFAAERGLDDCVLLNSYGRVAETAVANIWWVSNGRVYTPPLSEGCVAGVMRRRLLEILPVDGYAVGEETISPEELVRVDEIFLSNAVRGVQGVRNFSGRDFAGGLAEMIQNEIISKIQGR